MKNHIHLIAVPTDIHGLAKGLGITHYRYSRKVNAREGWSGYLWQGRFASYPLSEQHLYAAIRYVETNPVRAKFVEKAEHYKWSSAKSHVYGLKDPLLTEHFLIEEIPSWADYLSGDTQIVCHRNISPEMRE